MNGTENNPARSRWRDFVNRREPAALRVLGLLLLLAASETVLMFWGSGPGMTRAAPAVMIPPLLTLGVILVSPWWSLPCSPAWSDPRWEVPATARRWVLLIATAVALLSMWPRSARLNHSFTGAEIDRLQTADEFSRESPPSRADESAQTGGRRLVWDHVVAQAAAEIMGQRPLKVRVLDERASRALPWVAGVIAVGLVVLLGAAAGSPRTGLAAGLILAMHPDHVRWSSEVADTSLSMIWLAAVLLCLLSAMRTNRWLWWIALGASEALFLLGHPEAMVFLIVVNGVAAGILMKSPVALRDRISHVLRLVVALAIAAAGLSVPFACITEFTPTPGFADSWVVLLSGIPWSVDTESLMGPAALRELVNYASWRGAVLFVVLPLLLIAGLYFMVRQDWRTRLIAILFVIFVLLPSGDCTGAALLLLPLVLAWAGTGLTRLFPRQPGFAHAPVLISAIFVVATSPILQRLMTVPLEPARDVAVAARRDAGKDPTVATFGRDTGAVAVYLHTVRVIATMAELNALIDAAYEQMRPLYIIHSGKTEQQGDGRKLLEELSTSGRFHVIREFPAFDHGNTYRLYQYQPPEQIIRLNLKPEEK